MADILLQFVEPVCDMFCCNPPIKHDRDTSKVLLEKKYDFGAPNQEDINSKSGEFGSAGKDFVVKNISQSAGVTIHGANVSIGSIKLNSTVTIKATGTVVIGDVVNYCNLNVTAKELYINGGLVNSCVLTASVTDDIVIRGYETATGTFASLVNKSEVYVGFQKVGEDFKNTYPSKNVVFEHKILNECIVRAFADNVIFKQELINSVVVDAYVKDYFLIGKSEDSSLINKCTVNVYAYKLGDKSEQAKLAEIAGQLLNECNVVVNASLFWLNGRVLNKCNVKYVGKIQQPCGMFLPWRRLGSVIAQDTSIAGVPLNAEAANPMQA